MRRKHPPVQKLRNGTFRLNLDEDEKALLRRLADELRALNDLDSQADTRLRRLFPTAYHEDPEHDAEYQRLMTDELRASRNHGIDVLTDALTAPALTEEDLLAMMRTLNSLRLILGTQLDVGEEDEPENLATDDPLVPYHHLYAYLGWLLEHTIDALSSK